MNKRKRLFYHIFHDILSLAINCVIKFTMLAMRTIRRIKCHYILLSFICSVYLYVHKNQFGVCFRVLILEWGPTESRIGVITSDQC